jgi:ribosomal protein S19E (S16A)
METPEIALSGSERDTLRSLAYGREFGVSLDWLAFQRLKRFGLVEETDIGPRITAAGKRTVASEAIKPKRE